MRQFRFNGDRAIPRDLNFRFELKPGNGTGARENARKKRSEA